MMKNRFGPRGTTTAMHIDYSTLTVSQAEQEQASLDTEMLSTLSMLGS